MLLPVFTPNVERMPIVDDAVIYIEVHTLSGICIPFIYVLNSNNVSNPLVFLIFCMDVEHAFYDKQEKHASHVITYQ